MGGAGFLGIWTAMMAAMMLPSTVPLVLRLEHATTRSSPRLVALAAGAVMWAL
jgi:predicted metal-binding membrane protein